MIEKWKKQHFLFTVLTIAIFAFAVFFLYKCWTSFGEGTKYIREYREAADVQLTEVFLNGNNPYRLQSLETDSELPPVLYQYSFLNSAVAALIAFLIGKNVILAHYLLAFLAMLGTGVLAFVLIGRNTENSALPMLGAVLCLFCHWRFGYLSTTPNSLGIFLTLLTFALATGTKIRSRVLWTGLLTVLLFYVKLYFITICISIFLFELITDRKEAWRYAGSCLMFGAGSILLIQAVWPLYFTYSIYFLNGMGLRLIPRFFVVRPAAALLPLYSGLAAQLQLNAPANVFAASGLQMNSAAMQRVFDQFFYMIRTFAVCFAVLGVSLIVMICRRRKVQISARPVLTLAVIQVAVQGLCLFVLGKADGAYLSYYLQLWIPYVIIAAMICLGQLTENDLPATGALSRGFRFLLLSFAALLSLYPGYKKLPLRIYTEAEREDWLRAEQYIDTYESSDGKEQFVYYVPELAYLGMARGKHVYDNGHVAVASRKGLAKLENDPFSQMIFPYAEEIARRNIAYQDRIEARIRNHEYRLVTADESGYYANGEILTESGYVLLDTLPLAVGNATYQVSFWRSPE